MKKHFCLCIMILLLGSCVSVQLPGGKSTPAKNVVFDNPAKPFKELGATAADKSWLSEKTGNTISFLSDCGGSDELSLQQIETESLASLDNAKSVSSTTDSFNGREARVSVTQGTIDGVAVQIGLIVFKKNGCNFTLSYGGLQKQYAAEENEFNKFKESFKAP